jgi:protoheme IX farnesyltransferase
VVARQIVAYAWVTATVSLAVWPVAGTGWVYPAAALVLGGLFVSEAHLLQRRARGTDNVALMRPMRMFHWSNMYLSLLFLFVALDPLLTR